MTQAVDLKATRKQIQAGFEALERGDSLRARGLFAAAVTAVATEADAWFGLSIALRNLGNSSEQDAALNHALMCNGSHFPALIAKGDLSVAQGDERAASSYYAAALRAAAAVASLPGDWHGELKRVESLQRILASKIEGHLLAALKGCGIGSPGTERVQHAVDLLLGRRQVYLQQPRYFYFPELPLIQFYDGQHFSWCRALEQATTEILSELRTILAGAESFVPYIQRDPDRPHDNNPNPLTDSPNWGAFYLIKDGVEVAENSARCPRTLAAMAQVPLCRINGRTPSILFSLLRPGTRIRPHTGFTNARLVCHLPLVIPPNCGLRVGNETRPWQEGQVVIFDDSIEHEAWNLSNEVRVVLIFDIRRPELSDKEHELIGAMLQAANEFGPRRAWVD